MPLTPKIDVELKPVELSDLEVIAQGNIDTLAPFHDDMEPEPRLADRVERQARRLAKLLSHPQCHSTKAVLASGPDRGKLVGCALWQFTRRGDQPWNVKRRLVQPGSHDADKEVDALVEEELWRGVDVDKWDGCWTEWDTVREGFMKGAEHWYLVPLWVLPEYKGLGIGRLLLSEIIDRCDSVEPRVPIYLEASAEGKPLYEKLGFVQVGDSYYKEMIRGIELIPGHEDNERGQGATTA
ncbi:hypothetical protein JCM10212_005036 [Sporobolomyces blumeae]